MQVRDIMSSAFAVIPCQASLRAAAQRMREFDVGVLPAVEEGELIGVLTDRDIAVRAVAGGSDPEASRVADILTPGAEICRDTEEVENAARRMAQARVRRLVVQDVDREIVGVLSVDDLLHRLPERHPAMEGLRRLPSGGPGAIG